MIVTPTFLESFVIKVYKYCIALELIQLARLTEFNYTNNLLLNQLVFYAFSKQRKALVKMTEL